MKKTIIILGMLIFGLSIFGVAKATVISDPWPTNGLGSEQNLNFIYNNLAGTSFAASNDIPQLAQPGPWTAGNWGVNVVVKFAGLNQTLGTSASGDLLPTITANGYGFLNTSFVAGSNFTWYDTTGNGTQDSNGAQFVAFQLTSEQINYLNNNFGTTKDPNGLVYLMGFEDTAPGNLGDGDFNDLIAVADRIQEDNVGVPEPATMLLLGSGLIGLAGFARRRFKK